jgi:hypothetical protein
MLEDGVVDEDVDSAELLYHVMPELGRRGWINEIGGEDRRFSGAVIVERDAHTAFRRLLASYSAREAPVTSATRLSDIMQLDHFRTGRRRA